MTTKVEQVRSLFDIPEKYLRGRQFDIRIRIETVQEFTKGLAFDHILDIGCGDGSISVPLLQRSRKLTLLDVSSNMLRIARNRIPSQCADDVNLINENFLTAKFESQSFDLVLCIGVLAHVDSAAATIAEIARILKPGASVILEFTDSYHFWGIPVVVYQKLLILLRPAPYALNRLRHRQIIDLCRQNQLRPVALYRYGLPPLGTSLLFDQEEMYKITRYLFGLSNRNRNRLIGNEYIYRLEKTV